MQRFQLIFFLITFAAAGPAFADTVETRKGKILEGEIVDEDSKFVYLKTSDGGFMNISKIEIQTVNGDPYHYSGQGVVPVKPPEGGAKLDDLNYPAGVTETRLKDYYQAHSEEFWMPVEIRLKYINAIATEEPLEKIAQEPSSSDAWKDAGWVKKGDTFNALFSDSEYDRIFNLKKGEAVLAKDQYGVPSVFWAVDRKEAHLMPYHEARPKALNKILNASRNQE